MAGIVPAVIGGVTGLGGAALGGKAQAKATEAQAKSAADALAYQKQLNAQKMDMYNKSMADYQQKWSAWEGNREALLKRYGIDIGPASAQAGAGAPGPSGASVASLMGAASPSAAMPAAAPAAAATPAAAPQTVGAMMAPQPLGSAFDWRAQGLSV